MIYRTAKEALVERGQPRRGPAGSGSASSRPTTCPGRPSGSRSATTASGFPATGTDRRDEGHLGLPVLVDRVVDLGGTVELGNRLDGGAVVTVTVPLHSTA